MPPQLWCTYTHTADTGQHGTPQALRSLSLYTTNDQMNRHNKARVHAVLLLRRAYPTCPPSSLGWVSAAALLPSQLQQLLLLLQPWLPPSSALPACSVASTAGLWPGPEDCMRCRGCTELSMQDRSCSSRTERAVRRRAHCCSPLVLGPVLSCKVCCLVVVRICYIEYGVCYIEYGVW